MGMPVGKEVYAADAPPVVARGASYTQPEVEAALNGPVSAILWDDAGRADLQAILQSVVTTEFMDDGVQRILSQPPALENWRVGEGLAEAFLTEQRSCQFPWPTGRDLKNPAASPAGTDLVGFQRMRGSGDDHRFAFGEVKTSGQEAWPPSVMDGRSGLRKQLEYLRDRPAVKDALVRYLGHHARGADWFPLFASATKRYLRAPTDVSVFGIMLRDVEPKPEDLRGRASLLAESCPSDTTMELRAIYLPAGSICALSELAVKAREGQV